MADSMKALIIDDNGTMAPLVERTVAPIGVDADLTTNREALTGLSEYDVLIDHTTDSTLTDDQLEALLTFVEDGNGYAGIHSASDLTSTSGGENREEPIPELRELIGGHFLTHPAQASFDVNIVYRHHPVSADLADFRVWDEPYVVDYDNDLTILARMDHPENEDMPVSWVKEYGEGRVFYCSLGHAYPAHVNDGVQELVRNGVRWAAGGPNP